MSEPLKGSKVHTIQNRIAAGGVTRISSSGPSVVRMKRTVWFWLPAAQLVSFSALAGSVMTRLLRVSYSGLVTHNPVGLDFAGFKKSTGIWVKYI